MGIDVCARGTQGGQSPVHVYVSQTSDFQSPVSGFQVGG